MRRALVIPVLAALLVPVNAQATPAHLKPVCNLVTDQAGDGGFYGQPVPTGDATDIVSGDVASGPRTVATVIRVKSLSAVGLTTETGWLEEFIFTVKGKAWHTYAYRGAYSYSADPTGSGGDYATVGGVGDSGSPATIKVDDAANTIRVEFPASIVGATKGDKFTGLTINTYIPPFEGADSATTARTYVAGTPSCVKVT